VEIDQKWSGILGVGATKTPIVRRISEHMGQNYLASKNIIVVFGLTYEPTKEKI